MTAYGLLGRSLGHSFSPAIHHALGNEAYRLYEVEPEDLPAFLAQPQLQGLNVTIPYKETVMAYCATISDRARAIGAVNTMVRQADGSWYGTNTDYDGFNLLLDRTGLEIEGLTVGLLGNGATAKTAETVLRDRQARVTRFARRRDLPFRDLAKHPDIQLLVNTTPVGMYPHCPDRLVGLDDLPRLQAVVDVVYNPRKTGLLLDGEDRGLVAVDGLPMLIGQALAAAVYFQGTDLWHRFDALLGDFRLQSDNLILIGMPGSGKTTLGRLLALNTGRPFVDCDQVFASRHGDPGAYIRQHGEAAFRQKESEIVQEVGKAHGQVIATGGGVVTQKDNRDPLWQNGVCYLLDRPLADLATHGRPLSQGGPQALRALYEARLLAYEAFSHRRIPLAKDPSTTAKLIWEDFHARAHS